MTRFSSTQIDDALRELLNDEGPDVSDSPVIAEKFQVQKLLGCSGQATIVLAFDQQLRRQVVLKIYHDSLSENQKTRVINEGRALARIKSQHVVQCYGVEEFDETLLLVLEYVEGQSLTDIVSRCEVEWAQIQEWFRQLVEAIDAAHQQGVLHLDLTPSNVMITEDDQVKLIDFGLVRSILVSESSGSGTPAFMPPEIANRSISVDERADIFGLGAVLFYMLGRRAPFEADNAEDEKRLAKGGTVANLNETLGRDVPRNLADVCQRCLKKERAERFASARQILQLFEPNRNTPDKVAFKKSRVLIVFTTLAFLAGVVFWLAQPTDRLTKLMRLMGEADQAILNGEHTLALKKTRKALAVASHEELRLLYYRELEERKRFLEDTWPTLSPQETSVFRDCYGKVVALRSALQVGLNNPIQEMLSQLEASKTIEKLEGLAGSGHYYVLYAREFRLRAHSSLAARNKSPTINLIAETKRLQGEFAELLGQHSELALYARESLAYEYQMAGLMTLSELQFGELFSLCNDNTSSASYLMKKRAANAQKERATKVLCLTDPKEAARIFKLYEQFQIDSRLLAPIEKLHLDSNRLQILYSIEQYTECVELGERLLGLFENEKRNLLSTVIVYAYLAAAYSSLGNDARAKNCHEMNLKLLAEITELFEQGMPWQVLMQNKLTTAYAFAARSEWDAAISDIEVAIDEASSNVSLPSDGVIYLKTMKLRFLNQGKRVELALDLAEELDKDIDLFKKVRGDNHFNLIAWKEIVIGLENSGKIEFAKDVLNKAIGETGRLKEEVVVGNWKEKRAWFIEQRERLTGQAPANR